MRFVAQTACLLTFLTALTCASESFARGGLGGFHGQGFHLAGLSAAYGGVSLGSEPKPGTHVGMHTGVGYGNLHFHPTVGYYAPGVHNSTPFNYAPGTGRIYYNRSYANPYAYTNPYIYSPVANPYAVPFAHPF